MYPLELLREAGHTLLGGAPRAVQMVEGMRIRPAEDGERYGSAGKGGPPDFVASVTAPPPGENAGGEVKGPEISRSLVDRWVSGKRLGKLGL